MLSILLILGSAMSLGTMFVCLYALRSKRGYSMLGSKKIEKDEKLKDERAHLRRILAAEVDTLPSHDVKRYTSMLECGRRIL